MLRWVEATNQNHRHLVEHNASNQCAERRDRLSVVKIYVLMRAQILKLVTKTDARSLVRVPP